jgi:hypothetical protein
MATAQELLNIEAGEIGYSRWNDSQAGTKYGRWYAALTGAAYYGTSGVPFCAMGQSWSFDQAGQAGPGMPCAGCGDIRNYAKAHNMILSDKRDAQPGDVVLFRWDGNVNDWSSSDHVGMVELNRGRNTGIQTIEFNTGNGQVLRRTRAWGVVQMIIRPAYTGSQATGKTSSTHITVDGLWGSNTTTAIQIQAACPYVDGEISRQNPQMKQYLGGCTTGWDYVSPDGEEPGSQTIKAVQTRLNALGYNCGAVDGFAGKSFAHALIAWGMANGSGATVNDSKLDAGGATLKCFQRALNAGSFF